MKKIQKQTESAKLTTRDTFFLALSVVNVILAAVRLMLLIRDICSEDEE